MKLKISIVFLGVAILTAWPTKAQTAIIAHRGFSSVAPENSLIAFKKAIECKADYFELDVHKTKNDSIVVIHDASLERTSSNALKGNINEMKYKDLKQATVGYPAKFRSRFLNEKLPTLREALSLAKGKIKVCIEIKVLGAEEAVLKIVNDLEMRNDVIIFSFSYPVLAKIRQMDREISTLFLINEADEMVIDYAKVIGSKAIGVGSGTEVTQKFLDFAHENGVEVWKWTVNDQDEMQRLIKLGLDGLITDYPGKAIHLRDNSMQKKD